MNMHDHPVSEASEAPDHGVVIPPFEQSDTTEILGRKIVRHQVLYKRSFKADELRATLKPRPSKNMAAQSTGATLSWIASVLKEKMKASVLDSIGPSCATNSAG
jgi:hypothetical protein